MGKQPKEPKHRMPDTQNYSGKHKGGCLSVILAVLAVLVVLLSLAGCGDGNKDLEGVNGRQPDKAEIYYNVDSYPNVVRICIDKVAFATTTRNYEAIFRVPEWDVSFCGATPK